MGYPLTTKKKNIKKGKKDLVKSGGGRAFYSQVVAFVLVGRIFNILIKK